MTNRAQLRKAALHHPETAERRSGPHETEFLAGGVRFAWVDAEGRVSLILPRPEADELLSAHGTAERRTRGTAAVGVRLPLTDLNGQQLNHWVRRAWLAQAPAELAERAAAAENAAPGQVGDLPRGIGGPATRALVQAGYVTLAGVAELTREELAALHGVGPKAVRVLDEALADAGLGFAEPS